MTSCGPQPGRIYCSVLDHSLKFYIGRTQRQCLQERLEVNNIKIRNVNEQTLLKLKTYPYSILIIWMSLLTF